MPLGAVELFNNMSLATGTRLGPYEILAPVGAGGMGEVYKARDTRLDRIVAIKVAKEQFTERFEREARAVAALNHPHICQLYDVGPNYLVMELVEGAPLKGPLPLDKAIEYAGQILDALDAAHKKGITHRDLKPANILVTKQGIKLLDFGLAKQTAPLQETDVTRALTGQGQILGTLQYMSPEQLQGKEVDARSDLFSFGCVLYELLTGKRAFGGESPASLIAAILERPAPSIAAVAPPALDRVLQRCLAKDPEDRWQSARDLKAALSWALEQPSAPLAAKPASHWWSVSVAAMVLSAVGGWTLGHFRQPVPDDRILRFPLNLPEGGQLILGTNRGGFALSPDGKTAAFVAKVMGKSGLWVQPLDGTAARLIPGTESAAYPFWSPDGKALAFFAEAGAKLVRVDVTGGAVLAICDMPALARGGTWIGDGRIIFGAVGSGLFQVSATGGSPSPVTNLDTSRGEYSHGWPQMLPHGRVLYWVQSSRTENSGVYASVLSKPTERVRLLTTNGNALYAAGDDGRVHLLWLQGTTLVAQDFDPGTLKLSGELHSLAEAVSSATVSGHSNAAVSSAGLLLYSTSSTLSQITWMDRTGKRLGAVSGTGEYTTFRVSPNGRRAVAALNGVGGSDLWVLELERGVATRFTSHPGSLYPVWAPDGGTILFQNGAASMSRKEATGAGVDQSISQSTNLRGPLDWSRDGRSVLYFEIAPGTNRDLWVLPVTPDGKIAPDTKARAYARTPFSEWHARFSPEPSPKWVAYQSNESGRFEVYIDSFPEPRNKVRVSTEGGQYPQWGPGARELFYVSADYKLMSVSLKLGTDSVEPSAPHELFPLPAIDDGLSSPYDAASDGQRFLVRATPQQQPPQALNVIVNWPALLKPGSARP